MRLVVVLTAVATVVGVLRITAFASSTGESAALDQCTNGQVSPLSPQPCVGSNTAGVSVAISGINSGNAASYKNWVNGNANGSKAHWRESEFISYRTILSGLSAGPHTMVFSYDTVHSGLHALDYLGSYDQTEMTSSSTTSEGIPSTIIHANNNSPCSDLVSAGQMPQTQCGTQYDPSTHAQTSVASPAATVATPAENLGSGAGGETGCGTAPGSFSGSQTPGTIDFFGPVSTSSLTLSASNTSDNVPSGTGQCTTTVTVAWKTTSALDANHSMVIAWGGHISCQCNWGLGNSSAFISGSPYHMSLLSLDGASTGSQDRALATSSIFFTPSVTTTAGTAATASTTSAPTCTAFSGTLAIGSNVCDTAALNNSSGAGVSGNVVYNLYSGTSCNGNAPTGTKLYSSTQSVNSNGTVPNSGTYAASSSGSYQWQAVFTSGNSLNVSATSACGSETFSVGPNSPGLGTIAGTATAASSTSVGTCTALSGTIAINSYACDTATLTSFATPVAGTVTYTLYFNGSSANTCTNNLPNGTSKFTDTEIVGSNGVVPNSATSQVSTAGNYQWQAVFASTNNQNNGSSSACEPFTVGPNSPTLSTVAGTATSASLTSATACTALSGSIAIGSNVCDTSSLSGAASPVAGSVLYTLYYNGANANTCTSNSPSGTSVFTDTETVDSSTGSVPNSATYAAALAGNYQWQAKFSHGNGQNNDATSACEPFTVGPNSPALSTVAGTAAAASLTSAATCNPLSGSIAIGSNVCDTSSLSGAATPVAGTVLYTLYSNGSSANTCTNNVPSGTPTFNDTETVNSDGSVPNSATYTATTAGNYQWQAAFTSTNGQNNAATSVCEPFTVGPNSPGLSTIAGTSTAASATSAGTCSALSGSIAINTYACDAATLTSFATPVAGSVTYTLYYNGTSANTCTNNAPNGTNIFMSTETVNSSTGAVPNSATYQVTNAGNYQWQATFSHGNGQNNDATGACEPFTVGPNATGMTTAQNLLPNDSATITGATNGAGGTVTFNLFSPSDPGCASAPAYTEPVTVNGNGTYSTSNTTVHATTTGTWRWQVVYSGDGNNQGTTSNCGVENFTITNG